MRVVALSTGSCGNSYIIEIVNEQSEREYILLDCGLAYKTLVEYITFEGISIDMISYLIITHEHSDHIKSLTKLLKHHPTIELIVSKKTYDILSLEKVEYLNTFFISHAKKYTSESFEVLGVDKTHDAVEPLSFIIQERVSKKSIAFFTDLGEYTPLHCNLLKQCNIIFLECNYDEELLKNSHMHSTYIQRLQSPYGHLSNSQAQECVSQFIEDNQTIVLSHISENVNTYTLAYDSIQKSVLQSQKDVKVLVSFQKKSTGWIG